MNEPKLCEQLARGDTKALGTVIEKYMAYVCTVARNFSRGALSREDIDDIAADVFCKLWEARENLDASLGLRPYLSAAARNAVKNRFRKSPPQLEDISELEAASDFLVEDTAEQNELLACLYEGVEKLSESDRELFFRFYFNGEKAARIAEAQNTTKGAIDQRLHCIRSKLREYLNERGYDHA